MIVEGYCYQPRTANDFVFGDSKLVLRNLRVESTELSKAFLPLTRLDLWFEVFPSESILLERAKIVLTSYSFLLKRAYYLLSPGERSLTRIVAHELGQSNAFRFSDRSDDQLDVCYYGIIHLLDKYAHGWNGHLTDFMRDQYAKWRAPNNPYLPDAMADEYQRFAARRNASTFLQHMELTHPVKESGDPRADYFIHAVRMTAKKQRIGHTVIEIPVGQKTTAA